MVQGEYYRGWQVNRLLPGDIILERGDNLLSRAILECQRHRGEGKSIVNHAALVVRGGNPLQAEMVEALSTVIVRPVSAYLGANHSIAIFRNKKLTIGDRHRIALKALEYNGRKYGFHIIAAHMMDYFLGGRYVFRRMVGSDNYPICSWIPAFAYHRVTGYKFNRLDPILVQPDDIWDDVVNNLSWEQV